MLCDRLTVPGKSVVLHEPMMLRRFGDRREHRVIKTLAELGQDTSNIPPVQNGVVATPWFEQNVIPRFSEYDFWGIKEVYLTDAEQLIRRYQPDRLLLLWRDPRDVALSFLELMNRALMSYSDRRTLKDEAWAMECLTVNAAFLHRIASRYPSRRLNYEPLMRSAEERESLLKSVALERFGSQSIAMVPDQQSIRTAEVQRHVDDWSGASLDRWEAEPVGWRKTFSELCLSAMQPYAAAAGYDGDRRLADFAQAPATADEQVRVFDPKYEPAPSFDFAYAKRRGRQRVATLLSPGMNLLDVGGTTATLAFMTDANVTVIDDGAAGKRISSYRWRDGIFPRLDAFDTCTFVAALEFVGDPLRMVQQLLEQKCRLIITYHCRDDLETETRRMLRFQSHLLRDDWLQFASSASLKLSVDWAFDGYQSLLCFDASNFRRPAEAISTSKSDIERST